MLRSACSTRMQTNDARRCLVALDIVTRGSKEANAIFSIQEVVL